jgi:hypothetical protein
VAGREHPVRQAVGEQAGEGDGERGVDRRMMDAERLDGLVDIAVTQFLRGARPPSGPSGR